MRSYLNLIEEILLRGHPVPSVQGVGCLKADPRKTHEMLIDFSNGHPIITSRSLAGSLKSIYVEMSWIVSGSCWLQDLHKYGVRMWDRWDRPSTRTRPEWQRPPGFLGLVYGGQLRNFGATRLADGSYANDGEDQLANLVEKIKRNPADRRNKITTWNPKDEPHMFIVCCWGDIHFHVVDGKLWGHHVQRSCDLLVGGAFDFVNVAILMELIGVLTGYEVGGVKWTYQDLHIYLNQIAKLLGLLYHTGKFDSDGDELMEVDQRVSDWAENPNRTLEQLYAIQPDEKRLIATEYNGNELADWLGRKPLPLPRLEVHPGLTSLDDFKPEHIVVKGYYPHPPIKGIPVLT